MTPFGVVIGNLGNQCFSLLRRCSKGNRGLAPAGCQGVKSDAKAYKASGVEKDISIIGKSKDGAWLGIKSKAVET